MSWRREVIGDAVLYQGDALELLPELHRQGVRIDLLATDPPYSSGGMVRGDRMGSTRDKYQSSDVDTEHPEFTGDNRDQRGFLAWASLWLMYAQEITKPGGIAALFSDWRQLPTVTDAMQAGGWVWRGIVPWDKVNARPMPNRPRSQCEFVAWGTNGPRDFSTEGAEYHPGILTERPPANAAREHSTQKPVGIMADLCKLAPPGGLVLDPFLGSGTTGEAAIVTGRRFIGFEKSPAIFDIACARLERAFGIARESRAGAAHVQPLQERLIA
jgi:site-specific DNA-methyltransferase (adenine-specific)